MNIAEAGQAVITRSKIRVNSNHGWAAGRVGIALGYNAQYSSVKVGFLDESGEYSGDYTRVPVGSVDLLTETRQVTEYSVKIWYRSGAYEGAPHCPEELARKIYADAAASAGVEFAELHGPSGKLVESRGPSDDSYPNAPTHNPFLPDGLTPGQ